MPQRSHPPGPATQDYLDREVQGLQAHLLGLQDAVGTPRYSEQEASRVAEGYRRRVLGGRTLREVPPAERRPISHPERSPHVEAEARGALEGSQAGASGPSLALAQSHSRPIPHPEHERMVDRMPPNQKPSATPRPKRGIWDMLLGFKK